METFITSANRGSISTGYDIDNSLKLEPDNSEFLSITNTSEGSKRTATYSFWLKRTELDASSYMQVAGLFNTGETVRFMFYQDHIMLENGWGGTRKRLTTNAVYRDTSAFYHFVVAIDTTQSTASNRVKLYVNGVQETSFSTEEYPDQNFDLAIGRSGANFPWRYGGYNATYYKTAGYLAEAHYIDGTQYAASDFGEFDPVSGIWKPIEFTGNYGTQGSYLNFSDASNLGANPEGSDIDAVLNNITSVDQSTDTPTNNFCTLNPLIHYAVQSGTPVISEGSTKHNGSGGWTGMKGTIGVNKGKWYWELRTNSGTGAELIHGIQTVTSLSTSGEATATSAHNLLETAAWYVNGGHWIKDETSGRDDIAAGSITQTYGNSVIHAVALNMDDGEITYYANGSVVSGLNQVDLDGLAGETVAPFASVYNQQVLWNFGGYTSITISSAASDANGYGTFEYAPPSGYYALCSKNLAEFG